MSPITAVPVSPPKTKPNGIHTNGESSKEVVSAAPNEEANEKKSKKRKSMAGNEESAQQVSRATSHRHSTQFIDTLLRID